MALPGKEIFRTHDKLGPIQVFDDGTKRYLAFGNNDEQSCHLKTHPEQLQHEYTRAMLLVLLFDQAPKKVLLLGLGGGALASCLLHYLDAIQITAIELRRAVIDIAYNYFSLQRTEQLTVLNADANDFLHELEYRNAVKESPEYFDLIFSDIYSADGADDRQQQETYIDQCQQGLSESGWLVFNCWKEHRRGGDLLSSLKERFDDVRSCTTQTGNWIVMAGNKANELTDRQLHQTAQVLGKQLGFSLLSPLSRLQLIYRID